jgi:signal transduction histidine kinase
MALTGALSCAELTRDCCVRASTAAATEPGASRADVPQRAKLLGRTLGERIRIEIKGEPTLWPVLADPAQVESSLINLAVNARDAMTEGGTLTIETKNVTSRGEDADIPPGDFVLLSVADTGVGMTGRSAGARRRAVLHDQASRPRHRASG